MRIGDCRPRGNAGAEIRLAIADEQLPIQTKLAAGVELRAARKLVQ
jgi:hypothetical protein